MRYLPLLFLTALSLRADALTDFQETLRRFTAQEPVHATIELAFADTTGGGKDAVTVEGRATAAVALGARGLQIEWTPAQLAAVLAEQTAAAGKPNQTAPTQQAMSRLDASRILDYLNAGHGLHQRLATAKLLATEETRWEDAPARLLSFTLEPPLSEEDRKVIKEITATAKVWVATDGTPLAAESALQLKGRAMVVIGFEHTEKELFTFARAGDRLVVTLHQRETTDSGGGQKARGKTTASLQLAAP